MVVLERGAVSYERGTLVWGTSPPPISGQTREGDLITPSYTAHCMGEGVKGQGLVTSFLSLASLASLSLPNSNQRKTGGAPESLEQAAIIGDEDHSSRGVRGAKK